MAKLYRHTCVHCGTCVRCEVEYTVGGETIGVVEVPEAELKDNGYEEVKCSGEICVPCLFVFNREIYYEMKKAGLIPSDQAKAVEEDFQY